MYNDEFDKINGEYRYNRTSNLPRDDYRPQYTPVPESPKKKGNMTVKVIALVLVCAIVGGLCGFGGAAIARNSHRGETAIQQSDRAPVEVEIKKVDGQTAMTPAEVYASTVNSTVSINTATTRNVFGQVTESASSGSGFIITDDGYIVTNQHVVSGASEVTVTLYNGEEYPATIIGGDADYDVAVIKIESSDLPAVTLGNSEDVNVGDWVMAIGNPLGELTFSMSQGSVSSSGRAINVDGTPFNMLQVDCAINPGNSGGALFDSFGNVIGVVYAKSSSVSIEGIGYAIPVNDIKELVTGMINDPESVKAQTKGSQIMLGITIIDVTEEMSKQYSMPVGVYIREVAEFSAAERAGLMKGDIIVEFGGEKVETADDLNELKAKHSSGDVVSLKVDRNGSVIELNILLPQPTEVETVEK